LTAVTVELRNVEGTEAALGWAGGHTIVADRPEGKAGGLGLGFNGAQLLALAIGGCFCNDLRYVAAEMDVVLSSVSVSVTLELEGDPPIATSAKMNVACRQADGADAKVIIERAKASCMVRNSVGRGFPVSVKTTG
jgi:organic hydroperoxide reductase OsmC/OhrA